MHPVAADCAHDLVVDFRRIFQLSYGDIGADVHWMKTAQEYADSGVINPYAAQSYVDLRSALAGALAGTARPGPS